MSGGHGVGEEIAAPFQLNSGAISKCIFLRVCRGLRAVGAPGDAVRSAPSLCSCNRSVNDGWPAHDLRTSPARPASSTVTFIVVSSSAP